MTGYYVLNTEKLSEAETRLAVKRLLAGEEGTGTLPENMTLLTLKNASAVPEALANATNLTVNALDYEDYKAARDAGEYDLLYLAVSLDYPDEAVLLHWFASASESNYAKYNSEEFDEMLSKIDTETEESARIGLVKGAMQLLAEEAVLLPQEGGSLTIFAPTGEKDEENAGLCVLAACEKYDILITGDLSQNEEYRLLSQNELRGIELLVAGHHGAATSTSDALLAQTGARTVILSVGADNSYGHPAAQTLARIQNAGAAIYRTDEMGTIVIRGGN